MLFGNVIVVVASLISLLIISLPSIVYTVNTPITGVSTVNTPDVGFGYTANFTSPPVLPIVGVPGLAFTITERVFVVEPHAFVCVYEINTVPVPAPFVTVAVIEPVPVTDANAGLLLVQTPPGVAGPTFIKQFGVAVDTAYDVVGETTAKPAAVGNGLTVT